jgi:hypothetical protein
MPSQRQVRIVIVVPPHIQYPVAPARLGSLGQAASVRQKTDVTLDTATAATRSGRRYPGAGGVGIGIGAG